MNKLHFKVSSGLKNIIGQDLITDEFIAIYELVKNSFDAYATRVDILFEDDCIIIQDNGKGMSYNDLLEKWLFVAYSAKQEGTEEEKDSNKPRDYRSELTATRYYAGAKGIGRFSCDRLGSALTMYSTRQGAPKVEKLQVDWGKFEKDAEVEFEEVEVVHEEVSAKSLKHHKGVAHFTYGTILHISRLRNEWNYDKLKQLRRALTKLINPFDENTSRASEEGFRIFLHAPEFLERDASEENENDRINGEVKNTIVELITFKSTSIHVSINSDNITTRLNDRGKPIYEIVEDNAEYDALEEIDFSLYFLNTAAKNNFTRRMGLPATQFGSVFLFKNGFRIYPFGEPGDDMLGLDQRKQQGHSRFLGTRDLLGRIDIRGRAIQFKETSSRDSGLVDTDGYRQLRRAFFDTALKPLERYVTGVLWAAVDERDRLSEEPSVLESLGAKVQVSSLLASLTRGKQNAELIFYDRSLLEVAEKDVSISASDTIAKLHEYASKIGDESAMRSLSSAQQQIRDLELKLAAEEIIRRQETEARHKAEAERRDAEQREREAQVALDAEQKKNTLLKSVIAPDIEEIISLHHQIGISSDTVSMLLADIYDYAAGKSEVNADYVLNVLQQVSLENRKILTISRFATKANFVMDSEVIESDILGFLVQYIENISAFIARPAKIELVNQASGRFMRRFRPIELAIVVDNLISNAKKAKAKNITVLFSGSGEERLSMAVRDDGKGIPATIRDQVFKFGFTTTQGSGLGLFHINQILANMNASIGVNPLVENGAELVVVF